MHASRLAAPQFLVRRIAGLLRKAQVGTQTQNWKTFLGVGIGSLVAGVAYRRMVKAFPQYWDERVRRRRPRAPPAAAAC